jgi:type IV secretory pathway VirB10-like protein
MKLSNNSIGALIFTALAIAVFVLMVIRPPTEGNAMNFGVPINPETATNTNAPVPETPVMPNIESNTEELTTPAKAEEMDSESAPAEPTETPADESAPVAAPNPETVTEPVPESPAGPVSPAN